MRVPKKIRDEIKEYCKLNEIEDIDKFIIEKIVDGFNIEKYGNAPFIQEVVVEKEVPVEVIKEVVVEKEVPIEVIKEVIKEIPIEKEVIKEVSVEKKIYVTDDDKITELGNMNNRLENNLNKSQQKIKDLEFKINKKNEKYNILNTKFLDKEDESNKKKLLNNSKDKEIKNLKNIILKLERENTEIKNNNVSHPNARPMRDIYDEEDNKGGHWGSNLSDKK